MVQENSFDNPPDSGGAEFATAVADAAGRIADILDRHPVRGGPYPIADVCQALAEQHDQLRQLVQRHPAPLAVDRTGRPDKLGAELASLLGFVQRVVVLYHRLDDLPERLRVQANRDLSATHQLARKVRDQGRRR